MGSCLQYFITHKIINFDVQFRFLVYSWLMKKFFNWYNVRLCVVKKNLCNWFLNELFLFLFFITYSRRSAGNHEQYNAKLLFTPLLMMKQQFNFIYESFSNLFMLIEHTTKSSPSTPFMNWPQFTFYSELIVFDNLFFGQNFEFNRLISISTKHTW